MLTLQNAKIGFIGFGNMASAIADGLLREKAVSPARIFACANRYEQLKERSKSRGITPCENAQQTAENADIVFLAVKPYMMEKVVAPIKETLQDKIVISVAAGLYFEDFEKLLLPGTHHLSTLPNTPAAVSSGIFICEEKHSLTEDEFTLVKTLLSSIALVEVVDTAHFGVAGTLTGCGPAFAAMFMEALADGAVLHGLPRKQAYRLAAGMLAGAGKLLEETGQHPGQMKDAVCSPGGTTIVGVNALEQSGFRAAVIRAIDDIEKKQ